jgi:hypothetical protein
MQTALRHLAAALSLVTLCACASAPPPPEPVWSGGDPARLAADKAECHKEADAIDVHVSAAFSDPRYGVTNAMAAYVDKDNPLANRAQLNREANFITCMTDKGWKAQ